MKLQLIFCVIAFRLYWMWRLTMYLGNRICRAGRMRSSACEKIPDSVRATFAFLYRSPRQASLLDRYFWWKNLSVEYRGRRRERIDTLVHIVVRFDSLWPGGQDRFQRVSRLLEGAATRPHLAFWVPFQIVRAFFPNLA